MSDKNLVLILERSNSNLKVDTDSGDYILEGVFAQFGVENNNKRIYEEKEYLPHLEYLKKKITENRLMGELDHPEKFEISLQKVSHIIEKLDYDKENRQILGRVRLLDTPSGKIAKNLVDSGVPISISSRAAGSVNEKKSVTIKRIFTYDLVADPGFENAKLNRINESLGLSDDDNMQIFSVSESDWNYEQLFKDNKNSVDNDSISKETLIENFVNTFRNSDDKVLKDITHSFLKKNITADVYINKINEHIKTMSNLKDKSNTNFVTVDALNRYSIHIGNELKSITEKLNSIAEHKNTEEIEELREEIQQLKGYSNYLAEENNNTRKYANYITESVVEKFEHTDKLVENLIKYTEEEISEKVNVLADWAQNEVAKKLNYLAEYSEYLASYTETEIAEKLNGLMNFTNEEVVTKLNALANYTNGEIREGLNNLATYTDDHIRENLEILIGYNDYLKEQIEQNRMFANYISENAVSKEDIGSSLNEKAKTKIKKVPKKNITEKLNEVNNVNEKIDILLEEIKKEKIKQTSKFPFIKQFSESTRTRFNELDETKKEKVKNAILETDYPKLSEGELIKVWDSALTEKEQAPKWLERAPEKYKKIYENLDPIQKNKIANAAKWYERKLNTDYQIKSFWETRGIEENEIELENMPHLNENKKETVSSSVAVNNNAFTYNSDFVNRIGKSLERYK